MMIGGGPAGQERPAGAGRGDLHEFMKGFAADHAPLGTRFGLWRQPEHRTERGRAEFLSWTLGEAGTAAPGHVRGP